MFPSNGNKRLKTPPRIKFCFILMVNKITATAGQWGIFFFFFTLLTKIRVQSA